MKENVTAEKMNELAVSLDKRAVTQQLEKVLTDIQVAANKSRTNINIPIDALPETIAELTRRGFKVSTGNDRNECYLLIDWSKEKTSKTPQGMGIIKFVGG